MADKYFKSAETFYKEMSSSVNDVNTDSHSLFYKQNMPVCQELSYVSVLLDELLKRSRAKSSLENGYYDDLKEICADMGIYPTEATKATGTAKITGNPNSVLPVGSSLTTKGGITYVTDTEAKIENTGVAYVNITASDYGSGYNCETGDISDFIVSYAGILTVTNEEDITNGYDEETPEHLYNRYLLKIQNPGTSGNKYHYENWALEVTGVGDATCVSAEESGKGGTVKIIIANSNKRKADSELIQATRNHIEEERPLLAGTLEVVSVKEVSTAVTGNVEIDDSVTLGEVQKTFNERILDYYENKVYKTKKISMAKIQAMLIDIDGVTDCSDVKINGSTENISLAIDEIAILERVSLGVL